MRATPLLPLVSTAAMVYPTGGFGVPAEPGTCVVLQVQRKRDEDGFCQGEYFSVTAWDMQASLSSLCDTLKLHAWDRLWLNRKPAELFHLVTSNLKGRYLACFPEDWNESALVALASEILKRAPVNAEARFLAACEQHAQMRRALATALAGLGRQAGKSVVMAQSAGHELPGPWHESEERHWGQPKYYGKAKTMDKTNPDKVW